MTERLQDLWRAVSAWGGSLQYGDVPTWIAGIVTTAALIYAARAAHAAVKGNAREAERDRIDADERRRRDERERRAQASKVAVWLDIEYSPHLAFGVRYSNTSQLPIRQVHVKLLAPNLEGGHIYDLLPPTSEPDILSDASVRLTQHVNSDPQITKNTLFSLMSPGWSGPIREISLGEPGGEVSGQTSPVGVEITFNDTDGIRWHRDIDGVLREVANDFASVGGGGVIPGPIANMVSALNDEIRRQREESHQSEAETSASERAPAEHERAEPATAQPEDDDPDRS